jgi:uncharacterized RDD family membrane protein YckC
VLHDAGQVAEADVDELDVLVLDVSLDPARPRVGFARALARTVLICLAIPPLIWDRDARGLHDRAVLTAVVNG